MKRALLLYSKPQFDPSVKSDSANSASIIARSLYSTLTDAGFEVVYIDPSEAGTFEKVEFDLFIGHPANWLEASKRAQAKINVVFMPTTHPLRRNSLIKSESKKWNVKNEELLEPVKTQKALEAADYIFQIGNEFAIQALLENGIPREKIVHLHYGIEHMSVDMMQRERNLDNYIHLASGLGLRKGLPETLRMYAKFLSSKNLTVVGDIYKHEPNYKYWKELIENTSKKYRNVTYLGYISSNTKEYQEILAKQAWLLYPAIEEGEPGTVLETMSLGVVPLITRSGSGINFWLTDEDLSIENQIITALNTTKDQWQKLSTKAKHYIEVLHNTKDWEDRLVQIWVDILNKPNFNRPLVSIIIPFFNKEQIVQPLLKALLENTSSYENYELHIIYDGCKDKTREKAQAILQKVNIPVFEYETDDIFEVKTNNLGFKNSNGKYCVIVQDDNFIKEKYWLEQVIGWMEENPRAAVVGGLAGVNFYQLDENPTGIGVSKEPREVYRRIDTQLTPEIKDKITEVDAVMRGPLFFRKNLLEKHGYLDEEFCPLHNDDMDYCFRMKKLGYSIFYFPLNVENKALTVSSHNPVKRKFWEDAVREHQQLFYSRWQNDLGKHDHYLTLPKPRYSQPDKKTQSQLRHKLDIFINKIKNIRMVYKNIVKKILQAAPIPLKLFFVRKFAQAGSLFTKLSQKLHIYGIQPRTIPWHTIKGDETLRVEYDLDANSIVFDIGGYEGKWSEEIFYRYASNIYIFEPIIKFYQIINSKFHKNKKVHVENFGLGGSTRSTRFSLDGNSSSEFTHKDSTEEVQIKSITEFIEQNNIKHIDLMKINVEGGEYEILEALIDTGWVRNISNIQIQFHDFVENAHEKMRAIQNKLKLTHQLTFHHEFVWENWKLKDK